MTEEEARELAKEHWEWLESILVQQLEIQHKLFVDAFVHGAKHERKSSPSRGVERGSNES